MGIAESAVSEWELFKRRPLIGLSVSRASVDEAKKSAVPERETGARGHTAFPQTSGAARVPRASSNQGPDMLFFKDEPLLMRAVELRLATGLGEQTVGLEH